MGSNRKLAVALIVASTALGGLIFVLLLFWVYHRRNTRKSHTVNLHCSGIGLYIIYIYIYPDICKIFNCW